MALLGSSTSDLGPQRCKYGAGQEMERGSQDFVRTRAVVWNSAPTYQLRHTSTDAVGGSPFCWSRNSAVGGIGAPLPSGRRWQRLLRGMGTYCRWTKNGTREKSPERDSSGPAELHGPHFLSVGLNPRGSAVGETAQRKPGTSQT